MAVETHNYASMNAGWKILMWRIRRKILRLYGGLDLSKFKYMGKIVAIGGGEIGRAGYYVETMEIDQEIVRLTGKKKPKLLFIPTASSDALGYVEDVNRHFGGSLGCEVDVLLLSREKLSKKMMTEKIMGADVIYVGGGNTLLLMKTWRKLGVDKIFEQAYRKGIVMAGVSAGSICWFRDGLSDSVRKVEDGKAGYIKVSGLGYIRALHCPHYDYEKERLPALEKKMQKTSGVAIALENCAALEVIDDEYRIITSHSDAKAYKIFFTKGEYHKREIEETKEYRPLRELLAKI